MSESEVYANLNTLLMFRIQRRRKTCSSPLSKVSEHIVDAIIQNGKAYPCIYELLDDSFPLILRDCQYYDNMPENKRVDAYNELCILSCLFVDRNQKLYEELCTAMKFLTENAV